MSLKCLELRPKTFPPSKNNLANFNRSEKQEMTIVIEEPKILYKCDFQNARREDKYHEARFIQFVSELTRSPSSPQRRQRGGQLIYVSRKIISKIYWARVNFVSLNEWTRLRLLKFCEGHRIRHSEIPMSDHRVRSYQENILKFCFVYQQERDFTMINSFLRRYSGFYFYTLFTNFAAMIPAKGGRWSRVDMKAGKKRQIHISNRIPEIHCDFYFVFSSLCSVLSDTDLLMFIFSCSHAWQIWVPLTRHQKNSRDTINSGSIPESFEVCWRVKGSIRTSNGADSSRG